MNPKERLLTTLDHQEPDKVPLTTRLWLDTLLKLRRKFEVNTDEEVYERLGIEPDRVVIGVGPPAFWEPTPEFLEFCTETGYDARSQYTTYEEWGIKRSLGLKIPGRALRQFYFTQHPWEQFTEASQIEEVELPDLDESGRFKQVIEAVKEYQDSRLIFGDLGHCQWTKAWELRGMMTFMKDLHTNPTMAKAILDRLNDYFLDLAERLLDIGVEGLRFSEDWGNNKSMFINPKMWRKIFKPRYKRLFDATKRRGGFIFFHSDGNITPIVGDLVEIGTEILNPVQPECMNQLEVKEKYGDKITIDTGISVQRTLPYGTVDDVKRETMYALKHLAPGGGFCYGTSHYALSDVPVENIVALYDTCKKYGEYPIRVP
jgi:uroporphyrinogen decarboxylase